MATEPVSGMIRKAAGFSMGWSILLLIVGIVALALPLEAGIAIAIMVAILVIIAGIGHLIGSFSAGSTGRFFWELLVGIAYLVAGVYLVMHPALGLISLTLALAILFFVEGILHLITWSRIRRASGSIWLLLDGVITIILAILIWLHWPSSSVWAIGTLLGINLLISGFTRVMYSSAIRRAFRSGEAAS